MNIRRLKMALISEARGRDDSETPSAYERLFGHKQLGNLISRVQSAVISMGNELEEILADEIPNQKGISIKRVNKENRIFKKVKNGKDVNVDCVIEKNNKYKLIEIKDGDTCDTKKVSGEVESLEAVKNYLIKKKKVPESNIKLFYCSFNAKDHAQIENGTKHLLPKDIKAMTGKELCSLLGVSYERITKEREKDQGDNLDFFIEELKKIPEVSEELDSNR